MTLDSNRHERTRADEPKLNISEDLWLPTSLQQSEPVKSSGEPTDSATGNNNNNLNGSRTGDVGAGTDRQLAMLDSRRRSQDYLESGYLTIESVFPGAGATNPADSSPLKSPDGGTWKKQEDGSWKYSDADGKPKDRFDAKVTGVTRGEDGSLTLTFADKTKIKQQADRSELAFDDKGHITAVTYQDGRNRQFKWDGDELVATKTRDGKWFERQQNSEGKYGNNWTIRGAQGSWRGKIEVDSTNGNYAYTPADGKGADVKVIARTDGATEQHNADGSYQTKFPNKASISYDTSGRPAEMETENGTVRSFGWSKEGGKDTLTSLKVKIPGNGGEFDWQKKDGQWYCNGEKSNFDFAFDKKTNTYTWADLDKKETHIVNVNGAETINDVNGYRVDKLHDKVVGSHHGDGTFEYKRNEKNELLGFRHTKDGKQDRVWTWDSDKGWVDDKGRSYGDKVTFSEKGEPVFERSGASTRIDHEGKQFSQNKDATTGAITELAGDTLRTQSKGGTERTFKTTTGPNGELQPIGETRTINGKTQTWERQKKGESYTDTWKCKESGQTEMRLDAKLTENGAFSYNREDGHKYSGRADGTETISNEQGKWQAKYKDGLAVEIKYPDGKLRTFQYDSERKVNRIDITDADGKSVTTWNRVGKDKWKSGKDSPWNAHIEMKGDSYEITDLDKDGKIIIRKPSGFKREEYPKEGKIFESVNERLTRAVVNGNERTIDRKDDGTVREIVDKKSGTSYRKEDGKWNAYNSLGEKIDDGHQRIGKPSIGDEGQVSFLTSDGTVVRQEMGKDIVQIGNKTEREQAIVKNALLPDEAKIRFIENLDKLSKRSDITKQEKDGTVAQIDRLLEAKGEKPFSPADRAKIAEQLAWHVANPEKDAQGEHPTCQVTDVRLSLERQSPSKFAKMIADVGIDGTFVTADGSTIKPPKDSLRPGKEEKTFPPEDGSRTWVGKISDVTMCNIHWQRQTTDPLGYVRPRGSILYEEVRPTGKDDDGSRVNFYEHRSDGWYYTELKKSPGLYMKDILNVYGQISGKNEAGRGIVHASRTAGDGVAVVNTVDSLKAQLSKGPWPKIVELQNNILYGKKPDGEDHEHVVIVTGYDPRTGKVAIDNSHTAADDRLSPDKQIGIDQLYAAMEALPPKKENTNQQQQQQQQQQADGYWQNGVYYRYQNNYQQYNGGYQGYQSYQQPSGYWQNGVYYQTGYQPYNGGYQQYNGGYQYYNGGNGYYAREAGYRQFPRMPVRSYYH